jgi:multicomponent Na+:H+ antiporter subunit D
MSDVNGWLVVWPVLVPLLAAAAAVAAWGRTRLQAAIGIGGILVQLLAAAVLFAAVWKDGVLAMSMGGWPAPFGIALAADTLGAGLTLVATCVALAIVVHAAGDAEAGNRRGGFFPMILALMAGVAGAFLTADLFNLYVWFEVTLISSFGLIVLGGRREQIDGAVKYALLNLLATTLLLIAIGLLYGMTGTLNMADLRLVIEASPPEVALETIAVLLLMSLGMKAALVPLFFWLPAAYHTPLPAVSAIFAALLTKVGVYALFRVFLTIFPPGELIARDIIEWLAIATMLVGAIGALAEADIRRLVSFTVISGVGVMVAGLAIASEAAYSGAIFYIVHSMIISAALFVSAGLIVQAGGGTRVDEIAGLYQAQPLLSVAFLIAGLSLAGIPPLAGFWPKVYLIQAGLAAGAYATVAAILLSGFLLLLAMGRTFALVFWRPAPEGPPGESAVQRAAPLGELPVAALIALVAATALIGLFSRPVVDLASRAATELTAPAAYVDAVLGPPEEESVP